MTNVIIPSDGGEAVGSSDRCKVHFHRTFWSGRYGALKVVITLPHPDNEPEYVESLKELPFEETHRRFSPPADDWTMDLEDLNTAIVHLTENDIDVSVDVEVAQHFEEKFGTFIPERRA